MGSLDGKVVLITGAAGGIGRATARHLHDVGAAVVATASSSSSAKGLADEFDSNRWATRALDVTNERDVEGAVDFTVTRHGRMDGIVNNAGILLPNDVVSATVDEYERTFDVNVKGVFLGCKYAVPALVASGGGSIVNIGSINSLAAEKQLTLYTASKGAVLMLTWHPGQCGLPCFRRHAAERAALHQARRPAGARGRPPGLAADRPAD
jgi:dihydroanticapsin dehydrogenase